MNQPSERIAHDVAMRIDDLDSKLDGGLGEYLEKYVDSYTHSAIDFNHIMDHKLYFLYSVMSKDVFRYYLDWKQPPYANTFQQVAAMIHSEYNSPARQNHVKNYLKSM